MFIFTTKFSRKKAVLMILFLAAILFAIVLFAGRSGSSADAAGAAPEETVRSEEDVAEYLRSLGWEISEEPIEVQEIVIPKEFTEVYENYNKIQKENGFDLSQYGGIDAVRYTYELLNYPGESAGIVADVIVAGGSVIGGDIQSLRLDGFMLGLTENQQ